jgi:hypothetical protein
MILPVGTNVFVKLGYLTVKNGRIVGERITKINGQDDVTEYYVHWYGDGDRPHSEEWFKSVDISDTPEAAFKY